MLTHLLLICTSSLFATSLTVQLQRSCSDRQASNSDPSPCAQAATAQDKLIHDAETNKYLIRRVEFLGNENTPDFILRRRMGLLEEGELFTRKKLVKSLSNVNRLKSVYRVQMTDVVLRVDESEKLVDLLICFRERKLPKK